jgi:DNA-binding response OmpR family regulator
VIEAEDGKDAMAKCQENHPDLVILDVILPDTTGHDLLPKLRTIPHISNLPVIMLTGRQTAEDKMRGLSAGVNEYITKPFNPEKLTSLVSLYLPNVKPVPQKAPPPSEPVTPVSPVAAKEEKVAAPASVKKQEPVADKKQDDFDPDAKTIFVVEDSPTSRKVLKMILKRSKFNVIEAATGKEALSTAEAIAPDLVLLDVMLPDMTGYDILPQIKKMKAYADTPIFILTGKRAPSDKMKGMLLGSNEYITKPFNPEKLLSLINNYI